MSSIDSSPQSVSIFTEDPAEASYLLRHIDSSSSYVNEVRVPLAVTALPFQTHRGKEGVEAFCHLRSVVKVSPDRVGKKTFELSCRDADGGEWITVAKGTEKSKL